MEKHFELTMSNILGAAEALVDDVNKHGRMWMTYTTENPKNKYTSTQRRALHLWCKQCAQVLTDHGMMCQVAHPLTGEIYELPWTMARFKENVYKFVLEAMTGKTSTEDQSTAEPSDVADVIARRYAENGLQCPPWPSAR